MAGLDPSPCSGLDHNADRNLRLKDAGMMPVLALTGSAPLGVAISLTGVVVILSAMLYLQSLSIAATRGS
jgi:hypothetical protein